MAKYENVTTGMVVESTDGSLDKLARWRKVEDSTPTSSDAAADAEAAEKAAAEAAEAEKAAADAAEAEAAEKAGADAEAAKKSTAKKG